MPPATASEGLARLDELIYPDLHQRVDPASRAAEVGWGLFFSVLHQVEAVLILHTRECCHAAAPNRRMAFEFAVFLIWLAEDGDNVVDVLNRRHVTSQALLATSLREHDLVKKFPEDQYRTLADTVATTLPPEPEERLTAIQPLLDEYGLGELRSYYQAESRLCHVTLTAAQAFTSLDDERLTLFQKSRYGELATCQDFCLMVLLVAMQAFNELLIGKPWTDTLIEVARRHGLQENLPRRRSG